MATEIDELYIKIESDSESASKSLDKLVDSITKLTSSLSNLNTNALSTFTTNLGSVSETINAFNDIDSNKIDVISKSMARIGKVDADKIKNLSTELPNLSNSLGKIASSSVHSQNILEIANSLAKFGSKSVTQATANIPSITANFNSLVNTFTKSFRFNKKSVNTASQGVLELATAFSRFGYKTSTEAIKNIPLLTKEFKKMLDALSKAPNVSKDLVEFTKALSNLSGKTINFKNLDKSISSTSKSAMNLTLSFGKLYAIYRTVIGSIQGLWGSVETASDYLETLNYFEEAFGQVADNADLSQWKELGYESAESYANSFMKRASELTSKLTGFNILPEGTLEFTGLTSLGVDPSQVMQYQAVFGQMASSMGVASETAVDLSNALTMIGLDLASVRNMDFESVWEDMASGLAGMSRTLDKYGVNIRNVNLQQKLTELGIEVNIASLNQNDKALLRTIILLENTDYAYGDLAETLNLPANQLRLLSSNMENLSRIIGNLFLPIVRTALPYINGFVISLQRMFTWVGTMMGVDLSKITESTGENPLDNIIDGSEELEETLDGSLKASEKLKKSLRGFDELKTISSETASLINAPDVSLSVSGGVLDTAFQNTLVEYQKAWDEAFANVENNAQEFADKIEKYLEPLKTLFESLVNFGDVAKPFGEGFGKGFTDFLVTLGSTTLAGIITGLDSLSYQISKISPDKLEKVGEALGILGGSVLLFVGATKISSMFSSLCAGLSNLGSVLTAHPVLATFSFGAGFIALMDLLFPKVGEINDKSAQTIAKNIENISIALKEAESNYKSSSLSSELDLIYKKWSEIAYKTGELTDNEKGLLKLYADQLKKICPEVTPYIDENGMAFQGVSDKIKDVIDKTKQYYKTLAAENYLAELISAELKLELDLTDTEKSIEELYSQIRKYNKNLTDEEIQGLIEVAKKANFRERFGKITGGSGGTADIMAWQLGIKTSDIEEFTKMIEALRQLGELQGVELDLQDQLSDIAEKITIVNKKYLEYKGLNDEAVESSKKLGSVIKDNNSILGNLSDNFLPDVITKVKQMQEGTDNATNSLSFFSSTTKSSTDNIELLKSATDTMSKNLSPLSEMAINLGENIDELSLATQTSEQNFSLLGKSANTIREKYLAPLNAFIDKLNKNEIRIPYNTELEKKLDKTSEVAKNLKTNLDKLNKLNIDIPVKLNLQSKSLEQLLPFKNINFEEVALGGYALGGFPNEGSLFMARENGITELVGNFGGRTGVANNEQIISAIEIAAYNGFRRAMSEQRGVSSATNVNVTLEPNTSELFKVIRKEENEYYQRTGNLAFLH